MTLPYFCFNGITSLEKGAIIAKGGKNSYNGAERDIEYIEIPGRSGALIIDNGRYLNLDIQYSLILLSDIEDGMALLARGLKEWLLSQVGYYKLWDTYDPCYFRYAAYKGGLDIAQEIPTLGDTTVTFTCKPFRYSLVGDKTITLTAATTITNPERFPSLPYIKVYGSGDVVLTVKSQTFGILSVDGAIEIDSEMMNVYNGSVAQNDHWESDQFPSFSPGENVISWTGDVSKIEIIPRWRTL